MDKVQRANWGKSGANVKGFLASYSVAAGLIDPRLVKVSFVTPQSAASLSKFSTHLYPK